MMVWHDDNEPPARLLLREKLAFAALGTAGAGGLLWLVWGLVG